MRSSTSLRLYSPSFAVTGGLGYARCSAQAELVTATDLHPAVDKDPGTQALIFNRRKASRQQQLNTSRQQTQETIMATQAEYDAVQAAVLEAITDEENRDVPAWQRGLIPASLVPNLAALCSKTAVDTLDAFRARRAASKGPSA